MIVVIELALCVLGVFALIAAFLLLIGLPLGLVMSEPVTWSEAYRKIWGDVFKD